MNYRYPIRKSDGKDFSHLNDIYELLNKEKHGQWLAGNNGMWHGGIHISHTSVPWSVIAPDNYDKSIPLQSMAGGEVVAWKVNQDYHREKLGGVQLQYSSSFLLTRTVHKPSADSATWLTFYTLYMHLAPLSSYPKRKMYQVTVKGNGLLMRQYHGGEIFEQPAPATIHGSFLKTGDKVLIEREETFLLRDNKEIFGLAKKIKNGIPQGQKFWTSVRPTFVEPIGERYGELPAWMLKAVEQKVYDRVVVLPQPFEIRAGDAVGFLAREDTLEKKGNIQTDWFTHIEVISKDKNIPSFLNNPGKLKSGKQYIRINKNQPLYQSEGHGEKSTFSPLNIMTKADAGKIVLREGDSSGKWFKIRSHTWIRQDGVKELTQHDLAELNFMALEQVSKKDFLNSMGEAWIGKAFRWFSGEVLPERGLEYKGINDYYSKMADMLDINRDGKISAIEMVMIRQSILKGLQHRNNDVGELLRHLIVKHESEWFGGSGHLRWRTLLESLSSDNQEYIKKWLDGHEWMSHIPAFSKDEPIWHFHPVAFLYAISLNDIKRGKVTGKEFVEFVFNEAKKNEAVSNVPAAITTAQAILETGYGRSVPIDIYSGEYSHNLFGIKAHGNPNFVWVNTHEVIDGVRIKIVDKFMKYDSYESSISGRSDFFIKNKRYHFLFNYTDPCEWALGLQHAGYATDPDYANKLINIMKREKLI
ncbi:glycoside hydrolase family 73 protein [Pectobacterium aroidearum]|uniref:glycoside hydrolase family 73 protein n=1 Tax=Pectobacterium aroidearum TaxID=1201031 RepID=UPI0032EEF126